MQYPRPATIRYKPLDDLETKISAQIKQAIHLDNVTLHQQYKYQTGKESAETSIKKITTGRQYRKETTPMIAVTSPDSQRQSSHGHSSVLKLITVTI
jgi:hypothetical protein